MMSAYGAFALKSVLLVIALGAVMRLPVFRAHAMRHGMLCAMFGLLLALPMWQVWGPRIPIVMQREDVFDAIRSEDAASALKDLAAKGPSAGDVSSIRIDRSPLQESRQVPFFLLLHVAGAGLVLLYRAVGVWRVARIVARARPFESESAATAISAAMDDAGIVRRVKFCVSDECRVPFVTFVTRPCVILPCCAENWDGDELRAVLIHELQHIRRRDLLTLFVADVATALHWFNPMVWRENRRLRLTIETACDEDVVASGVDAVRYATVLLDLARRGVSGRAVQPVTALAHEETLLMRVRLILDPQPISAVRSKAAIATAAFAGIFVMAAGVVAVPIAFDAIATANVSDGGTDVSGNAAGVQLRWVNRYGLQSAAFLTGSVNMDALRRGDVRNLGGSVVLIDESPGAVRVGGTGVGASDIDLGTQAGLLSDAGLVLRNEGSVRSRSTDAKEVFQAGWIDGHTRYGLIFRGNWTLHDAGIAAMGPGDWFVMFTYDRRTEVTRVIQFGDSGFLSARSSDGASIRRSEAEVLANSTLQRFNTIRATLRIR